MSTISATIDVGDNAAEVIAGLLSRFPTGRRVHVALTDEPNAIGNSEPDLVDWLLACPEQSWFEPLERGETTDDLRTVTFE